MFHRPFDAAAPTQRVRAIFLSDTHLGCRHARAEALLEFLNRYQPDHLYLVGDMIDGWRLRKSWFWQTTYTAIVHRVLELLRRGTQVYYTPGNHDEFLRPFVQDLGSISLADEFIHVTADDRRLLVIHGDQFDGEVRPARWLSIIGDVGYDFLVWANSVFNACRQRLGFDYWSLSTYIKHQVKQATSAIVKFEAATVRYARSQHCDGVVCGHIHTPSIREHSGLTYYNTGDWVESCTALIEQFDGQLHLIRASGDRDRPAPSSRHSTRTPDRYPSHNIVATACTAHGEQL